MAFPFDDMARAVITATGVDCILISSNGKRINTVAAVRHIVDEYAEQSQGVEFQHQVTVLNADLDLEPDLFQEIVVSEGSYQGTYIRQKKIDGDGNVSIFMCTQDKDTSVSLYLMEDGVSFYLLENDTDRYAME